MRIAVLGATGQLGREVVRAARKAGHEPVPFGHGSPPTPSVDVTDPDAVARAVDEARPDAVANCAAFTDVDGAEARPREALRVNAAGALHVARAAAGVGARPVQVSTDYVFSGDKGSPYHEGDVPAGPVNVYGVSKLAGEQLVRQAAPESLVVRVAALFGLGGRAPGRGNFVETVLGRAEAGQPLWGVDDVRISPTSAAHAARALVALLEADAAGVHHCVNRGVTTWHGFARQVLELAGIEAEIRRVEAADTDRPASRPSHSALVSRREGAHREIMAPSWQQALAEYVEARVAPRREEPYTVD